MYLFYSWTNSVRTDTSHAPSTGRDKCPTTQHDPTFQRVDGTHPCSLSEKKTNMLFSFMLIIVSDVVLDIASDKSNMILFWPNKCSLSKRNLPIGIKYFLLLSIERVSLMKEYHFGRLTNFEDTWWCDPFALV